MNGSSDSTAHRLSNAASVKVIREVTLSETPVRVSVPPQRSVFLKCFHIRGQAFLKIIYRRGFIAFDESFRAGIEVSLAMLLWLVRQFVSPAVFRKSDSVN